VTAQRHYLDPRVAARYDRVTRALPVVTDDIPFYVGLARETAARGESVLELGCGTGRVTIPMAAAGAGVTGLDNAAPMIEIARRKATVADVEVTWVEADMASFALDARFGLVAIPFRSFCLLLTEEAQRSCLACAGQHLLPRGRLALNFFNPDPALVAALPHDGAERVYGPLVSRAERDLRLRYVFRDEMERLLVSTGFAVEALYGWFDGRPFQDDSDEMVWVARKVKP
jgi:2-polyprenyl-3-methyl-5-hydroxy-6-metoxy-1,4-benzoquinol methylase